MNFVGKGVVVLVGFVEQEIQGGRIDYDQRASTNQA